MTSTVQLGPEGQASVKLDGSGNGTAKAGPLSARETWSPQVVSVNASTNVKEASCKISVGGDLTTARFVDGTLSGSTGDSTGHIAGYQVKVSQYIFATWAGGDAGATATMVVTGTKDIT